MQCVIGSYYSSRNFNATPFPVFGGEAHIPMHYDRRDICVFPWLMYKSAKIDLGKTRGVFSRLVEYLKSCNLFRLWRFNSVLQVLRIRISSGTIVSAHYVYLLLCSCVQDSLYMDVDVVISLYSADHWLSLILFNEARHLFPAGYRRTKV